MPFTFSHSAFSLLFYKHIRAGKLSATGLILGCMAPDFEYFLRMKMQGDWGHQWWGMLLLDVPIALIIALLFHRYIRDAVIRHAPKFLQIRLMPYYQLNWFLYLKQHFMQVIFSIVLGIFSHVLWDAFTHSTGFFVQYFTGLQQKIEFGQFSFPIYKVIQHTSSVLGLVIITLYIYSLPKLKLKSPLNALHQGKYWAGVILCFSLFLSLWAWFHPYLMLKLGHVVVASIACLFWSILIGSILDQTLQNRIEKKSK